MDEAGRRNLWWWPILVAGALGLSVLMVSKGVANLTQVQEELKQVRQATARLERDNRALYRTVLRLRDDPQTLLRTVRRDLGLVRADEVVYQDPGPPGLPGKAGD